MRSSASDDSSRALTKPLSTITTSSSAVIYQIQIVGEAARYLSPDLRRRYPAIPWQDIVGMRSKLVHDYFGINREAIWLTATRDIPTLVKDIQQILAELENL